MFIALSHQDTSEGLAENDPGSAVLILDRVAVMVPEGWVDMVLLVGGTRVLGLTIGGTKVGNRVLEGRGVVARSRGLLGLESGLMSLGFRLSLGLRWKIL